MAAKSKKYILYLKGFLGQLCGNPNRQLGTRTLAKESCGRLKSTTRSSRSIGPSMIGCLGGTREAGQPPDQDGLFGLKGPLVYPTCWGLIRNYEVFQPVLGRGYRDRRNHC